MPDLLQQARATPNLRVVVPTHSRGRLAAPARFSLQIKQGDLHRRVVHLGFRERVFGEIFDRGPRYACPEQRRHKIAGYHQRQRCPRVGYTQVCFKFVGFHDRSFSSREDGLSPLHSDRGGKERPDSRNVVSKHCAAAAAGVPPPAPAAGNPRAAS